MIMASDTKKRKILVLLLLLNLTIVFGSLYFIGTRLVKKNSILLSSENKGKESLNQKTTSPVKKMRNILFQYRDSRPRNVSIVGDFNNWTSQKMAKGENHIWEITLQLAPGEYKYQFVADGKWIKDPYNPHFKPDGYGGENSLLIVSPFEDEKKE